MIFYCFTVRERVQKTNIMQDFFKNKGYKNNRFTKRTKEGKVHCYRHKDGERVEKD